MSLSVAALCRPDAPFVLHEAAGRRALPILARTAAVLAATSMLYGFSFGLWRDPLQAAFAAVKMPVVFLGAVGIAGLGNAMIAQLLGVPISGRQTLQAMLLSFAVTTVLLAALAPVFAFLALALPPPSRDPGRGTYFTLLALHTGAVAGAGVAGNLRLWRLLRAVAGSTRKAALTMACWLGLGGAAGSELSWICSPFLARPDRPVVFLNPNAFRMNMYEYLWQQGLESGFQRLERPPSGSSKDWKRPVGNEP